MTRRASQLALSALVACSACDRPAPTPTATATPTATTTATTTVAPTAIATTAPTAIATTATVPRVAATAILRSAVAIEPAARTSLAPGAEVVVHPSASFEVELTARSADARLVLVDARDDLVAASGTRELSSSTRLTLAPSTPLVPGSRYVLRIDGASDRDLHDDAGRAFTSVTLPILAAGTPPPPEPKKPERKRKRR